MTSLGVNETFLDKLDSRRVPALPAGVPHLLKSLTDENIGFRELAAVIEQHPIIAGRLIALANSAWSCPPDPISSLDMVCGRLGIDVVRSTGIALAVASPFDPRRCPGFDVGRFWTSALMTADASSRLVPLASAVDGPEPSVARTAGLLHNIGLLWLADQMPNEVSQAITNQNLDDQHSLTHALEDLIGFDAAFAGGHLATAWNLPEPLVTAIGHCGIRDYGGLYWETACIVGAAKLMVSAAYEHQPLFGAETFVARVQVDPVEVQDVFEQVEQQLEKTSSLAKILFGG